MAKTKQEKFRERRYLTILVDQATTELFEFKKGKLDLILPEEYKSLYGKKIVEIDAITNTKHQHLEPIVTIVVE